jgi:Fe-S-cluster containining protein
VMKGTNSSTPRCVCLQGNIGELVQCSIYPQRASVCREFPYSGQDGQPNERCEKARAAWGLPPLFPSTPIQPNRPRAPRAA